MLPTVPDRTRCPRCQKVGLVRFEHIVRGTNAERVFSCGACDHSWVIPDDATEDPPSEPTAGLRRRAEDP